jgi:hypothetical protein
VAGERVSNLKVLKGYLYADVRLGHDAVGHEVTINVRLSTARGEVQEALEPLYELLRSTGRSLTIEAASEAAVAEVKARAEQEVREKAVSAVEARVEKHATQIEHALVVLASVTPNRDDDAISVMTDYNRRSALRRLRDAIVNARF